MVVPLLPQFKVPQIKPYDGITNPMEHAKNFRAHKAFHKLSSKIAYWSFPFTLEGGTRVVYGPTAKFHLELWRAGKTVYNSIYGNYEEKMPHNNSEAMGAKSLKAYLA